MRGPDTPQEARIDLEAAQNSGDPDAIDIARDYIEQKALEEFELCELAGGDPFGTNDPMPWNELNDEVNG